MAIISVTNIANCFKIGKNKVRILIVQFEIFPINTMVLSLYVLNSMATKTVKLFIVLGEQGAKSRNGIYFKSDKSIDLDELIFDCYEEESHTGYYPGNLILIEDADLELGCEFCDTNTFKKTKINVFDIEDGKRLLHLKKIAVFCDPDYNLIFENDRVKGIYFTNPKNYIEMIKRDAALEMELVAKCNIHLENCPENSSCDINYKPYVYGNYISLRTNEELYTSADTSRDFREGGVLQ